jgi:hypothetical protein
MQLANYRLTIVSLIAVGCGGSDATSKGSAEVIGNATYRDAATQHDGTAQEPAEPSAQAARVFIIVEGSGDIPDIDPQCSLDPVGSFEAHYLGTLDVSDGGVYTSSFGNAATEIVTPSGCTIPELTVGVITNVRIRGELDATTQNCDTFCAATARAGAEESCGASASAAMCRADAEAQAQASCMTSCSTQTHAIVAETEVGAAAIGSLDASALRAAALGEIEAELTFDHMEDEAGDLVDF